MNSQLINKSLLIYTGRTIQDLLDAANSRLEILRRLDKKSLSRLDLLESVNLLELLSNKLGALDRGSLLSSLSLNAVVLGLDLDLNLDQQDDSDLKERVLVELRHLKNEAKALLYDLHLELDLELELEGDTVRLGQCLLGLEDELGLKELIESLLILEKQLSVMGAEQLRQVLINRPELATLIEQLHCSLSRSALLQNKSA